MEQFITWFNDTAPGGEKSVVAAPRAGIAHLYFVCVHRRRRQRPHSRALAEKSLAQNLVNLAWIALAYTIERKRSDYYGSLERNNNEIEHKLAQIFAHTVLEAQNNTIRRVDFYVLAKAKF